tara:strand:- start:940 stop:1608 length:669 start_codon:yes stop_codon:yes gene_type:complete
MLKVIFKILILSSFLLLNDNLKLVEILKDNEDWQLIDLRNDSIRVYEKSIENMPLKALKVEKIINFNPDFILQTIMDINQYPKIMSNSDITSFIIGQRNNMIYAYNHFPIPLPFIEDRHYIFKIRRVSKTEVYWHLVDYLEVKSNMRLKKITDENPSAIYMDYGAGFWETVPLTENLSQVSYVLYMDSGGSLSNNLNDLLTSQSIINLYKSVLNEGYKKSKQ